MLAPRPFGNSGVAVSPLIFGSMRLDPKRLSPDEASRLLAFLAESGVTGFHSSHEYDTHAFFCRTLRALKLRNAVYIMKLGEPHFDAPRFRRERFTGLVEQELRSLGAERIGIVQWLLRATPNDDATRLPLLRDCIAEVEDTAQALKQAGKIGALATFPYSTATADICLPRPACDGLVTYLNLAERDYVPYLDDIGKRGQGMIAIRPLCAGKLLDPSAQEGRMFLELCRKRGIPPERQAAFALGWPLLHPATSGVVLGIGSVAHARQALQAVGSATPDSGAFMELSAEAESALK